MKKNEKEKLCLLTKQIYYTFLKLMLMIQSNKLIDLISILGLELKKLKAFSSDDTSVITGVNNGVTTR